MIRDGHFLTSMIFCDNRSYIIEFFGRRGHRGPSRGYRGAIKGRQEPLGAMAPSILFTDQYSSFLEKSVIIFHVEFGGIFNGIFASGSMTTVLKIWYKVLIIWNIDKNIFVHFYNIQSKEKFQIMGYGFF
jgi:hypothetical protein